MRWLGSLYEEGRERIVDVVTSSGGSENVAVPACPEWTVHDVLAHLSGNCADIIAGNVLGAATNPWTAAQVDARRDRSLEEILAEWENAAPQVAAMLDDFPGRYGIMVVSDLTSHEHDIRGALGRPGARASEGVAVLMRFLVEVFLHFGATELGLDPLEVRAGDRSWLVGGNGPPKGDPDGWRELLLSDDALPGDPDQTVNVLSAPPFELVRAASGRRSAAQIRRLEWSIEPEPYVPIFGFGPFVIRSTDLVE